MDKASLTNDLKKRMDGALTLLEQELKGLRTGRASTNLLDHVMVEVYGDRIPISQVGTVSVADARMLTVQVWDKGNVKSVEKAIAIADLGVTPIADGQTVRVPLPLLSQERRMELVKIGHKYAEQGKVSVRNVRRDGMDFLKKLEKDSEIAKDEHHTMSDEVQKLTDDYVKKIDAILAIKENEILSM
jgi:ribosome recycling factor